MTDAPASWSFDVRVWNVDELERQYTLVLVSRRMLRALAAATFAAAVMLLALALIMPLGLAVFAGPPAAWWVLPLIVLILGAVVALAIGLTIAYVRTLAALAAGSRRALTALLILVLAAALAIGWVDVYRSLGPDASGPLRFFGLGALAIHLGMAAALVLGPMELLRSTPAARAVLGETRMGSGIVAEVARLLDLPDARAFRARGTTRAWAFVTLSLLLEGGAFYWLMEWPEMLTRTSERPWPADLSNSMATIAVVGVYASAIAALLVSFLVIRWMLVAARSCRTRARRLTLQSAADAVATDRRPPVLFLRSFEEEHVPLAAARVPWFLRLIDPGSEYRTLEEMILLNLSYVGPVVAVADPSRETPVGAARWRLRDDEWRRFVEEQIRASALIVVGMARTSGLRWEIEAIRRAPGALDKAVFVCPPGASQEADALAGLGAALGGGDALVGARSGAHVLMARSLNGDAHVYVASALTEMAYYVALRSCTLPPEPL